MLFCMGNFGALLLLMALFHTWKWTHSEPFPALELTPNNIAVQPEPWSSYGKAEDASFSQPLIYSPPFSPFGKWVLAVIGPNNQLYQLMPVQQLAPISATPLLQVKERYGGEEGISTSSHNNDSPVNNEPVAVGGFRAGKAEDERQIEELSLMRKENVQEEYNYAQAEYMEDKGQTIGEDESYDNNFKTSEYSHDEVVVGSDLGMEAAYDVDVGERMRDMYEELKYGGIGEAGSLVERTLNEEGLEKAYDIEKTYGTEDTLGEAGQEEDENVDLNETDNYTETMGSITKVEEGRDQDIKPFISNNNESNKSKLMVVNRNRRNEPTSSVLSTCQEGLLRRPEEREHYE